MYINIQKKNTRFDKKISWQQNRFSSTDKIFLPDSYFCGKIDNQAGENLKVKIL